MKRVFPPLPALTRRQQLALVGILVLGALLRVGWAGLAAEEPGWDPLPRDPGWYLHLGDMVSQGDGYSYITGVGDDPFDLEPQASAYYPPGYPLSLGAVFAVADLFPGEVSQFAVAIGFNIVLSVATVGLVFALARRLADVQVGLVAAAVVAFWPNLIYHSGVVLTETLFLFLLALMLLVALPRAEEVRSPGTRRLLATGVLLGAVGLVRPTSLVLAPLFLLLWLPWGWRTTVRRTALVAVGSLLVILPWTLRNTVEFGEPVAISTNTGDNICIGNQPGATGGFGQPDYCFDGVDAHDGTVETRGEFELRRQAETLERARESLADDPARMFTLMPARLRYTLDGDADGVDAATDYGRRDLAVSVGALEFSADAYYAGVMVLGVAGAVVFLRRDDSRRALFLVTTAAAQLVPPLLTFGDQRFKVPIYPAVAVCAAVCLVALARQLGWLAPGGEQDDEDDGDDADDEPAEPSGSSESSEFSEFSESSGSSESGTASAGPTTTSSVTSPSG